MWRKNNFKMKLFLSGAASHKYCESDLKNALCILESFFYVKEWQIPYIKNIWKDFLLDSGAFTFINSNKNKDFDEYLKKYIQFINQHDIKNFFELDIDCIVGYKKVLEYRKVLEKGTNKKCIPVWHKTRGKDEYIKLCKEYNYIAIGGFAIKEILPKDYTIIPALLSIAKKYNCKVHALGFTPKNIQKYRFYSADSITWLSGPIYGKLYYFKNNKLHVINKEKNKRIKDYKNLTRYNLREWIKFQKYLYRK